MTDYPLIDPKDVREGDVVQITYTYEGHDATLRGAVWRDDNSKRGDLYVGFVLMRAFPRDVRLVHRPAPPEPPLRVSDWVRHADGDEWQVRSIDVDDRFHGGRWPAGRTFLTRIEPPVGWPVGVPDGDGGTRWWACHMPKCQYHELSSLDRADNYGKTWADLLAAGGVPAPAVTR